MIKIGPDPLIVPANMNITTSTRIRSSATRRRQARKMNPGSISPQMRSNVA